MNTFIAKIKAILAAFRADSARSAEIAKSLGVDKLDDVKLTVNKANMPVARAIKTGDIPVSDALAKEIRQLNVRLALGRSMSAAGIPLGTVEQMARLCESQSATLEASKVAKKTAKKTAKSVTVNNGTVIPASRQTSLVTAGE